MLETNGGEASCLDSSGRVLRQRVVSADSRDEPSQGRIWQQLLAPLVLVPHILNQMILVSVGVEQLQKVQSGFLRQSGKFRSRRASRAGYTSPIPPIPREAMIS